MSDRGRRRSLRHAPLREAAAGLIAATLAALALLGAATLEPASAETPTATILDSGRCALPPNRGTGEGMGPGWGLSSVGTVNAVMIFVDFADRQGPGIAENSIGRAVSETQSWYWGQSRGRFVLNITPVPRWIRLAKGMSDYGLKAGGLPAGPTGIREGQFDPNLVIPDAIRAADAEVDFSRYSLVYVVVPEGTGARTSFATSVSTTVDGVRISRSVLMTHPGPDTLIHETGHTLGLPDLYDASASYDSTGRDIGRAGRFAGGWDVMSSAQPWRTVNFIAWHRWKLGWLDAPEIRCLGSGILEETIVPLTSTDAGVKAVIIPVSRTQNYVVEVRERGGDDAAICSTGVLVYLVDQAVSGGRAPGPIQVRAASAAADPAMEARCGLLYDAPYHHQRVATFSDPALGMAMEVLGSSADGFRVRVTGPSVAPARARGGVFVTNPITIGPSRSASVVFSDGTVDQLEAAARAASMSGVWAQDAAGTFRLLVVGGPAFLKEQFKAAFPDGFPGPTAVTLTR